MKNYGFVKVASAIPLVKLGDCESNALQIISMIEDAEKKGVEIVCFPEMSVTGYNCEDLFAQSYLLQRAEEALQKIAESTKSFGIVSIVGAPVKVGYQLLNAAVVMCCGKIISIVPKTHMASYNEFYESRWFTSADEVELKSTELCGQTVNVDVNTVFSLDEKTRFSIEICEDLWTPIPPSCYATLHGSQIVFNLSASNETVGKNSYRLGLISQQSARCFSGYVYSSAGVGESSTDLVFGGHSIIAENGSVLANSDSYIAVPQLTVADIDVEHLQTDRQKNTCFAQGLRRQSPFMEMHDVSLASRLSGPFERKEIKIARKYDAQPFVPNGDKINQRCEEIYLMQVNALATRMRNVGIKHATIGISGGLDSTWALIITAGAFDKLHLDRKSITAISMPGPGTTIHTRTSADELIEKTGVADEVIDINDACHAHMKDIGYDESLRGTTYENAQARERTQILMDTANMTGGIVIGTGDLSELALGWATYNGDQMSMYGVNAGVPKTLIRSLITWAIKKNIINDGEEVLQRILDTPVSPELLPFASDGSIAQKTEDLVGPYELHDFFLYHTLRYGSSPKKIFFLARKSFEGKYDEKIIHKWLTVFYRRFFAMQFKRSAMPDGPKIGSVSLSPRGDWRMCSDVSSAEWLKEMGNVYNK